MQNRSRFRSQFFPKGTCWAFQASKHCSGCEFKHECFKCGAHIRVANVLHPNPEPLLKACQEELKRRVLHSPPVTPVNVDRHEFLLQGYNPVLGNYLVGGFRCGFRINFVGEQCALNCPNLRSALDLPGVTSAKLQKECDAGRIVGPFTTLPFSNFHTSPIGLVPKKDPSVHLSMTLFLIIAQQLSLPRWVTRRS